MSTGSLLIVAESFPFGVYADFLRDEIGALVDHFGGVTIAPTAPTGARQQMPHGVSVDLELASRIASRRQRVAAGVRRTRARTLIKSDLRSASMSRRCPSRFATLVAAAGVAAETEQWAKRYAGGSTVAMTVWLGPPTLGLSMAGLRTVSRAHRGDLFASQRPAGYIPLERAQIEACAAVYSVSDAGTAYLRTRFPNAAARIVTRRLGTPDPGFVARPSDDGTLRVVSCSSLTAPKRPSLLAAVITETGRLADDVEWHHFGSGRLSQEFRAAIAGVPPSVRVHVHGQVPNDAVLQHYEQAPVDVLVNVSDSEGVPVSMMEAISVGIPIVGTDAGGVREIVNDITGRLLPVEADARSIAGAVLEIGGPSRPPSADVRRFWAANYAAERNYEAFAEELARFSVRQR